MHACINDVPQILELWEEAHQLSENHAIPFSRARSQQSLESLICNPLCLVAYNGHGVLVACANPSLWHEGYDIADLLFYARKGGLSLLREYLAWAKGFHGTNDISIGVSIGGEAAKRSDQLFQRLGFKQIGTQYKVTI